jgi:hypothetical protein
VIGYEGCFSTEAPLDLQNDLLILIFILILICRYGQSPAPDLLVIATATSFVDQE